MLGDGDEHRLVVRRRVDRAHLVEALRQTRRDGDRQDTVDCRIVHALEEGKLVGVAWLGLLEAREGLDDHMRMANNVPVLVNLLGRGKVRRGRVGEGAGGEVLDRELDVERRVRGGDVAQVGRVLEFHGRHVRRRRDDAHRRRVAGPGLDLLTVHDGLARHGRAEVDKVVRRGERSNLARRGHLLAVLGEPSRND